MKKVSILHLCLIGLMIFFATASIGQFRVIGYVHASAGGTDLDKIAFEKLTHVNIAFVNPDSLGRLVLPDPFDSVVSRAHRYQVKVLASIGGGSYNPVYKTLLKDAHRAAFIDSLVQLAVVHELDGIDVDLEGDAIDEQYERLIVELSSKLKPAGKLLTAAFATWNANLISNNALKKFDFINIMSYDQTGPWRPKEPGPHSTYAQAEKDLDYWILTRAISRKKVNLGVPFYGYCFGTGYGESLSYGEIVEKFASSAETDVVVPETGGIIHYNGSLTIKAKTKLAQKKAGGIMIWQVLQDGVGEYSLLQLINSTLAEK